MKKSFLLVLPALLVLLAAGLAISHPENAAPQAMVKRYSFALGGFRMGLSLSEPTSAVKKSLNIDHGVIVEGVVKGSPAEEAGIKEGDVILSVNDKDVEGAEDIQEQLSSMDKPEAMDVQILRDGHPMTVTVTPEKRDFKTFMTGMQGRYLGVELQDLDPDLAQYFQVDPKAGVLVARVVEDSPAQKAGLRSGDVITSMNGKKMEDADGVREALNDLNDDNESVSISILRHGKAMNLTATPEERHFNMHDMPALSGLQNMHLPDPETMDQLREQMENMKDDYKSMKKEEIQQLKDEIEKDLRQSIDELKDEIKTMKKSQ